MVSGRNVFCTTKTARGFCRRLFIGVLWVFGVACLGFWFSQFFGDGSAAPWVSDSSEKPPASLVLGFAIRRSFGSHEGEGARQSSKRLAKPLPACVCASVCVCGCASGTIVVDGFSAGPQGAAEANKVGKARSQTKEDTKKDATRRTQEGAPNGNCVCSSRDPMTEDR